jgi:UDP-N-acetylmuramate: L-alanyl-gamma-D-glutamyl-meso-diaminopimelate ligase
LKALRIRHPDRKIWAIFEPRSNTTRRRVFQKELAEAFQEADWAIIAEVARLHLLPEDERLSPDRLMVDIRNLGPQAEYLADADRIVEFVAPRASKGDILCVFSNGGFGGIHDKLLKALSETQSNS